MKLNFKMHTFQITRVFGASSEFSELFQLGNKQYGKSSAPLLDKKTHHLNNFNNFAQKF